MLAVGYTHANRGADLRNPLGSQSQLYGRVRCSLLIGAGEQAVISRLIYEFSRVGLEGVSGYVLFVHGWDRADPATKNKVPNENEFDADLQWRPDVVFPQRVLGAIPVCQGPSVSRSERHPRTNTARSLTTTSGCSEVTFGKPRTSIRTPTIFRMILSRTIALFRRPFAWSRC